jgi:DNA-binding beta-propeller fold protein YncE
MMTTSMAFAGLLLSLTTSVAGAAEVWRADGMSTPESAVFDEANGRVIVSNIVGEATEADGNGTLTTVDPDGNVIAAAWVEGLDAPKGLAISGDSLYVADLTNVRVVDLASGEMTTIAVEGATFLNDVTAAADGTVYVTDTFANRIYAISGDSAELFLEDPALDSPNGILADGDTLVIASFGQLAENPDDMVPGGMLSVDIASKAVTPLAGSENLGFLDGLVKVGDRYVVTDFFSGKVMAVGADGAPTDIAELGMGAADLGTDGEALYVPLMMENQLLKFTLD